MKSLLLLSWSIYQSQKFQVLECKQGSQPSSKLFKKMETQDRTDGSQQQIVKNTKETIPMMALGNHILSLGRTLSAMSIISPHPYSCSSRLAAKSLQLSGQCYNYLLQPLSRGAASVNTRHSPNQPFSKPLLQPQPINCYSHCIYTNNQDKLIETQTYISLNLPMLD